MKALAQNWLIILLLIVILCIAAAIYAKTRRARIEAQIEKVRQIISSKTGIDGVDIKTLLRGVSPQQGFNGLAYARKIKEAPGTINDDEAAVYAAFASKTKAQIAAISHAFSGHFGEDLDEFLLSFLDKDSEYSKVLQIVKVAA